MASRGKAMRVKNKTAAEVQITSEQILREAHQLQEAEVVPPKQDITDPQALEDYRARKRKEFEDKIRMQRMNPSVWLRYAAWEIRQNDLRRARSIFERLLDVDYRHVPTYLKYAEMEMKYKNINSARNVWDRAVKILPRVDQFWYKYIFMEDILGNTDQAREIFERWMEWDPDENAWSSYIKFEVRHKEFERAREVYARFVQIHPKVSTWIKWAKFEERLGDVEGARHVYENAIEFMGEEGNDEKLFIAFAKLEENAEEFDRARAIYKHALDNIPKSAADSLYKTFITFEKQHGKKIDIEDVILSKRRFQYEEELKINPRNYDIWFDYARLEESQVKEGKNVDQVREVYERAIGNIPPAEEKRFWRRYVYLWINYALFEELETRDVERTRAIYTELLRQIPHSKFSFTKIWVMFAEFEVRRLNMDAARKILGRGIGVAPKEALFKAYIALEQKLGNIERCRILYQKWLELSPQSVSGWCAFANLEASLAEFERVRAIYDLAIQQDILDTPELIWKAYIDFETTQKAYDRVRALYQKLLDKTKHVRVWISYAQFESKIKNIDGARKIFKEAIAEVKTDSELKEERVMLVEALKSLEEREGDAAHLEALKKELPQRVKKRRQLFTEDGAPAGYEEYFDYIFPEEEDGAETKANLALLEAAHRWKKQKQEA